MAKAKQDLRKKEEEENILLNESVDDFMNKTQNTPLVTIITGGSQIRITSTQVDIIQTETTTLINTSEINISTLLPKVDLIQTETTTMTLPLNLIATTQPSTTPPKVDSTNIAKNNKRKRKTRVSTIAKKKINPTETKKDKIEKELDPSKAKKIKMEKD